MLLLRPSQAHLRRLAASQAPSTSGSGQQLCQPLVMVETLGPPSATSQDRAVRHPHVEHGDRPRARRRGQHGLGREQLGAPARRCPPGARHPRDAAAAAARRRARARPPATWSAHRRREGAGDLEGTAGRAARRPCRAPPAGGTPSSTGRSAGALGDGLEHTAGAVDERPATAPAGTDAAGARSRTSMTTVFGHSRSHRASATHGSRSMLLTPPPPSSRSTIGRPGSEPAVWMTRRGWVCSTPVRRTWSTSSSDDRLSAPRSRDRRRARQHADDEAQPSAPLVAAHLDQTSPKAGVDRGRGLATQEPTAAQESPAWSKPTMRSSGSSRTPVRSSTNRCTSMISARTSSAEPPSSA